jgi:hypothetical protein
MVTPARRSSVSERRRFVAAWLALLGSLGCSREQPTAKRVAKMRHDPWVLWPEAEPPAGGWPVLLFLHGQGEAAWTENRGEPVEHGPDALLAHGSPVALYRAKDARVKTLWQNFVLIAPQALNEVGIVADWHWSNPGIRQRLAADVEQVVRSRKVNTSRMSSIGFSRGGWGCFQLDGSTELLQFRKIASVDAQALDELPAAVRRKREVRAYYAPSTYEVIRAAHEAAEKVHGKATPPINLITRPQKGSDDQAHAAIGTQVFSEDELYRWLLA